MADDLRSGTVAMLPVKPPLPPIYLTASYRPLTARPFVNRLVQMARSAATEYAAQVDARYFWT